MTLAELPQLVAPLLDWYGQNARMLPWRENTDPYRVWVSEIMLQQTRVEAAKPYYDRFMQTLPGISLLAGAPEAQLMKLWEGLGYYTRARNLQKAAQIMVEKHGGQFPRTYEEILALPGIGGYTAGAICSIALGKPTPAVDGNVLRVISRLTGDNRDIALPVVKGAVTEALAAAYPARHCGDFTQSLMELGALVCVPNGIPKCGECPLQSLCTAYREGNQQNLPNKAKKKPRNKINMTVLLLRCNGRVAVRQRESGGLLGGLWEFPHVAGRLTQAEVQKQLADWGLAPQSLIPGQTKKHIFTHLEWDMMCFLADCGNADNDFCWVTPAALQKDFPMPTAFGKFVLQLK